MNDKKEREFVSMTAPGLERALIGCIMQAADAVMPRIQGLVSAEDFHPGGGPREIFQLIETRYAAGLLCDLTSLIQGLMDTGKLDPIGGAANLSDMLLAAVVPHHGPHYARAIREKGTQRRLSNAADKFLTEMTTDCESWKDHSAALVEAICQEQMAGAERAKIVPIKTAIMEAVEELETAVNNRGHVTHGLATGFTALDRMFMGLRPTQNVVIAGRPSMGKTALAVNILENISIGTGDYKEFYLDTRNWPGCKEPRQKALPTLLICLESSQIEMASRMLCGRARVSVQRIRDGLLGNDDISRITRSSAQIGFSQLYIWDAPGLSVEELDMEVTAFKQRVPDLAMVCVDHCGLLSAKAIKNDGDEYARFSYVSKRLRLLWKKINVVGLPLWQLNRGSEKRSDSRPKLSDIRGTGQIEEDASQVLMPYRPHYYDNDQPEDEAFIVVAKNRGGPTNSEGVKVKWEGEFTKFSSRENCLFSPKEEERQDF